MHEGEKWKLSRSVVSDSSWPRGLQPIRLLHPWDFPGRSTGVGCHCLRAVNSEEVTKKIRTSLAKVYTHFLTSTYPSLLIKNVIFLLVMLRNFSHGSFMTCFREGWCVYLKVTFLVLFCLNFYSLRYLIWQGIMSWTPSIYWWFSCFYISFYWFLKGFQPFHLWLWTCWTWEVISLKRNFAFTFN